MQASLSHRSRGLGLIAAAVTSAAGLGILGGLGDFSALLAMAYGALLALSLAAWTAGIPALLAISTIDGFMKHAAPTFAPVYMLKDVLLVTLLLGMLVHVALKREMYAHLRWYGLLPWALFIAYMATQVVHPPFGLSGSIAGFRARAFFSLLYLVGAIYFVRRERTIAVANLVIVLAVFAAIVGIVQHAVGSAWMRLGPGFAEASLHYTTFVPNGDPLLEQVGRLGFRSYSTLVDPAALGLFCAVGILFALAELMRVTRVRERLMLLASMGCMAVGLFDSGTRAAMIGLGVGVLVILGCMVADGRIRISALLSILVMLAAGLLFIFTTKTALTERTTSSSSVQYALQTRERGNSIVLEEVGQYPLGHGLGSTGAGGGMRKEPGLAVDNTYLAYLYETGPIGLAIFLIVQVTFLVLAVRAALAKTPYHSVFAGLAAAQCALLVAGLATQGTFDYAPISQIFWLFCGGLARSWDRHPVMEGVT